MTSCIMGKKIRAMGPVPLELFSFVVLALLMAMAFICVKDISGTTLPRNMGPGPLELFPFVVLVILMAMGGGISEHMLTSWSTARRTYHFNSFLPSTLRQWSLLDQDIKESAFIQVFKHKLTLQLRVPLISYKHHI